MTKAQKKHEAELLSKRIKRYHENHNIRRFASLIDGELLDALNNKLKEKGINKRQFLEDAVERFLK